MLEQSKLIRWLGKLTGLSVLGLPNGKHMQAPVTEIIASNLPLENVTPAIQRTDAQRSEFYRLGKETAENSRGQKFDAAVWEALKDYVEAQVTLSIIPNFDAVGDRVDARVLTRLDALDDQLQERKEACEMAGAEFLKRKAERAACGSLPLHPSTSPVFRWTAAGTLTFSIAPTIYCYFTGLFPMLKWVLSAGFAAAAALLIVTAILPDEPPAIQGRSQSKESSL